MAEEYLNRLKTLGRNDLCTCGSGKKYKKCHLLADEEKEQQLVKQNADFAKNSAIQDSNLKQENAYGKQHKSRGTTMPKANSSPVFNKQVSAPRKTGP
jgi:hypothetical protein